jgi:hypothetical protein
MTSSLLPAKPNLECGAGNAGLRHAEIGRKGLEGAERCRKKQEAAKMDEKEAGTGLNSIVADEGGTT